MSVAWSWPVVTSKPEPQKKTESQSCPREALQVPDSVYHYYEIWMGNDLSLDVTIERGCPSAKKKDGY